MLYTALEFVLGIMSLEICDCSCLNFVLLVKLGKSYFGEALLHVETKKSRFVVRVAPTTRDLEMSLLCFYCFFLQSLYQAKYTPIRYTIEVHAARPYGKKTCNLPTEIIPPIADDGVGFLLKFGRGVVGTKSTINVSAASNRDLGELRWWGRCGKRGLQNSRIGVVTAW